MTISDAQSSEEKDAVHERAQPLTGRTPRRAIGIALAVAGAGFVLDRGMKAVATAQLQQGDRVPLSPPRPPGSSRSSG